MGIELLTGVVEDDGTLDALEQGVILRPLFVTGEFWADLGLSQTGDKAASDHQRQRKRGLHESGQ
jgi:hypothetical protein